MHLESTDYKKLLKERFIGLMTLTDKTNISDIARRTGINRKTIERISDINHKRSIEYEEIQSICQYFNIDEDQLDGSYLKGMKEDAEEYLKVSNALGVLDVAQRMKMKALFPEEKLEAHYYLGEAFLRLNRMEDACHNITKGLEIARHLKWSEESVIRSLHQMMSYLVANKKYEELSNYAQDCLNNTQLTKNLVHLAKVKHYIGISLYFLGNKSESKRYYEESMSCYLALKNESLNLARIMATIADMEYFEGNYKESLILLQKALEIQLREDSIEYILKTKKDIARCFQKIGSENESICIVEDCLKNIHRDQIHSPMLLGELLLIKLTITKSIEFGVDIIQNIVVPLEVKKDIADFIIDQYRLGGDVSKELILNCYEIARS